MRTKDRDMMLEYMAKNKLIDANIELVSETEEIDVDTTNDEDIATTSDGRSYLKSAVRDYLLEKGYPFTQDTVDMAAKMLFPDGLTKIIKEKKSIVQQTEFDDASDAEIMEFVQFQILKNLVEIRKLFELNNQKEYEIEIVNDTNTGSTNVQAIIKYLKAYSEKGWVLKCVFTNELGKDAMMGVNSTIDQVVLIFERSVKPKI